MTRELDLVTVTFWDLPAVKNCMFRSLSTLWCSLPLCFLECLITLSSSPMASNNTASIAQARKLVEQLKMEANIDRIKVRVTSSSVEMGNVKKNRSGCTNPGDTHLSKVSLPSWGVPREWASTWDFHPLVTSLMQSGCFSHSGSNIFYPIRCLRLSDCFI